MRDVAVEVNAADKTAKKHSFGNPSETFNG
jgi:hypothetical protein